MSGYLQSLVTDYYPNGVIPSDHLESAKQHLQTIYPERWALDNLGPKDGFLYSKQVEVAHSVRDYRRTAVPSCHAGGKTHLAGMLGCWWIATHKPGEAGVITSAPTGAQVKRLLWKHIARIHSKARLEGTLNQVEWWLDVPDYHPNDETRVVGSHKEMVGIGRKPSDYNPDAFQGDHPLYMLIIFDEACGMHKELCDSVDSLMANENARFLMIGNPTDPNTEFARNCKPGSGWNVVRIRYDDTPNFTGEDIPEHIKPYLLSPTWVEEKKKSWGEDNPRYISRVLAEFPAFSEYNLIPYSWAERALELEPDEQEAVLINVLGVDVGAGGDKNTIAHRKDDRVKIILRNTEPDTMVSLGNVIKALRRTGAARAYVDYIGVGRGLVDRAKEKVRELLSSGKKDEARVYQKVVGVSVSSKPVNDKKYHNLRAELAFNIRERLQNEELIILPGVGDSHEKIEAQLRAIESKPTSSGKEMLVDKKTLKKKYGVEMDEYDAVALSCINKLPSKIRRKQPRAIIVNG